VPIALSPYDTDDAPTEPKGLPSQASDTAAAQRALGGGGRNSEDAGPEPRVVMQFPEKPDQMLLSGELAGGRALSGRALVIDQPLGEGHVVMFALRPFWRWQTQGTYALGFNTIINWDHLDAGKQEHKKRPAEASEAEAATN
jgi:hypothetical protein